MATRASRRPAWGSPSVYFVALLLISAMLAPVVYIIIGLFVAWDRGYATLAWLKTLASAVLAVFLWWLVLLGVNLHVH